MDDLQTLFGLESSFHKFESMLNSFDTIYGSLEIKNHIATEDDPFADVGEGFDAGGTDGGAEEFDESGDDGDSFSFDDDGDGGWGDDDDGDTKKKKNDEVDREDLISKSNDIGANIRKLVPGKIVRLKEIVEANIITVDEYNFSSDYDKDLGVVKASYEKISKLLTNTIDIIDTKTFEEIFTDYISILALVDKVNDLHDKIVKQIKDNNK